MTLHRKYLIAFDALVDISAGSTNPQGVARDALQACVDVGDSSEADSPMRKALESARDELKRQREIWTGSKNETWAIAAIDTELGRINHLIGPVASELQQRDPCKT